MKRRKKRYYDGYTAVKSHQHISRLAEDRVNDWEVEELFLNDRASIVNKRRRSRVGFTQTKRSR